MGQDEVKPEIARVIVTPLSERQRLRVEVIQDLMGASDREEYRQRQQAAAERLNLSISSIQRLVREWKQKGIAGLSWRDRLPQGELTSQSGSRTIPRQRRVAGVCCENV